MARTSSSAFKDAEFDIREIAARLGVVFLIEGSVRHSAGRLEVRARLIEAATGFQKWSATRDVDAAESLWLPRQVSPEIARELGLASQTLPGINVPDFGTAGRRTIDAYDAYRKARYHWAERTRDGVRTAMMLYQQAIAADPSYSEARSGLADIYVMLAIYGHLPPDMAMPTAKKLALEALELNPQSAEAHTTMGMIAAMYDWQHDAARASFLRAIELRPGYPDAHQWYASFHLCTVGRLEEAIQEQDTALLYDPLSLAILGDRGNTLSLAGRHEEGLEACLQVQARDPQSFRIYWQLGLIYERMGRMQEALGTFERCRALSAGDPFECNAIGSLGHALGLMGRKDDASACIADLEKLALEKRYNPLAIALVHVGMDNIDKAFEWLNLAANARIGATAWVAIDPRAARIKDDLRFRLLLERFGLSDSEQALR
jgi:tetratricopeptide (TPR) repeat protein